MAVQALIIAVENGFQTVLMAPTEILVEQHYETLTRYLKEIGYSIALLTARVKGKERKTILQGLAAGEIQIAIGTHAIFQKGVSFHRLGFVVIDEQHRFGVRQRSQLQQKGEKPDTLVMTATPIPRSLALTLYGTSTSRSSMNSLRGASPFEPCSEGMPSAKRSTRRSGTRYGKADNATSFSHSWRSPRSSSSGQRQKWPDSSGRQSLRALKSP